MFVLDVSPLGLIPFEWDRERGCMRGGNIQGAQEYGKMYVDTSAICPPPVSSGREISWKDKDFLTSQTI